MVATPVKQTNKHMFQQTPRKPVLSSFAFRPYRALKGIAVGIFALFVATFALTAWYIPQTSATTSNTINFQARLQSSNGSIAPDGDYNVEFKLYDALSGGTLLWTEDHLNNTSTQVHVVNGYLTVNLGSITSFGSLNWNQQMWLTMNVGDTTNCTPFLTNCSPDGEMSPRIQLTAVPYALQAGALGNGSNSVVFDSSARLEFQQASIIRELGAASGTALTIQGGAASSGTNVGGNLLLQGGAGASTGASGSVIVRSNGNNSASAFQVQNASNNEVLTVDTSNGYAILGKASTVNGVLIFQNSTNGNAITIQSGVTSGSGYTLTLPTALPGSTQCLQSTSGGVLSFGSCTGGSDSVTVNGAAATDANFVDVAAAGTTTGTSWSINTASNPDDITLNISNASATQAGSVTNAAQTFAGDKTFNGNILAGGAATGTTATTSGTGTDTTTLTFTGTTSFANNDIIFIDNAGQDFYTRIVSGGTAASVTVSPAVTFETARTVTKYTAQSIGATASDYTTLTQRYFQGYFLGGIVTGTASTSLSDNLLQSTTGNLNIQETSASGSLNVGTTANNKTLNLGAVGSTANTTTVHVADSTGAAQTITIGGTNTSSATSHASTAVNIQGGATGFKVANTGVTLQTWTNSTTALQLQDAAGSNILKVGTTNLGSISTTTSMTAVEQAASAIANGYAYVVGGTTTGAAAGGVTTVQYAKVNTDGTIGTWSTTSALLAARSYGSQTAPIWNGYIYYAGGYNTSGTVQSTVYYAKLNVDGSVGTWATTTSLATGGPGAMAEGAMMAANGYLYWLGGYNGSADVATSYYAKINADGTIGSWASTGITFSSNLADFQAVVSNGYIYTAGGWTGGGPTNDIFSAKLNSTGTLTGTGGNWYTPSTVAGNSLPGAGLNDNSVAVVNGQLYVIGGATAGAGPGTTAIYAFPLPADGSATMGTRVTLGGTLGGNRWKGSAASANGYVYYFGGDSGTGSAASGTVSYGSTTRISLAGDLDLLGLTNGVLNGQSNGGGGTIYAGNIYSAGDLSVMGNATLQNGLSVKGPVVVSDTANSTSAFQIQNASGVNFLNASTSTLAVTVSQGNVLVTDMSAPASPAVVAGANTGGTLSGAAATTYYYKITALNASGETITSSEVSINGQGFTKITDNSTSLTAAASGTAGNVTCNNTAGQGCKYKVTFVTANGESLGDAGSTSLLNVTSKQINLTNIPTSGSAAVTGRNIYRSTNGGAYLFDQLINNNTATTATDNVTTPAGAFPGASTATTNTNNASVSWTAVTNATSYRIYRGTSSGGENAYQTSATSPFTDTGSAGTSQAMPTRSTVSQLGVGTAAPSANLDVEGNALFKNTQNTTTALQVQNAAGTTVLNIDTSNSRMGINTTSPQQSLDTWNSANTATYGEVARFVVTNNAGGTNYSRILLGQNTTNAMFIEAADQSNTKGTLLLQPFGGSVVVGGTSASYQFQVQGSTCLSCGNASVVTVGTQDSTHEGAEFDLLGTGSNGQTVFDRYDHLGRYYWNDSSAATTNQFQIFNAGAGSAGLYVQGNSGFGSSSPQNALWVTADGTGNFAGDNGVGQLVITGASDTTKRLGLMIDTTANIAKIQGTHYGTGAYDLALESAGGNVGIGTTSIGHLLTVSKTASSGKVVGFSNFTTTDNTSTGILELRGGWSTGSAANSRYIQFYDSATTDTNGTGEGSVDARAGGVTYNNSTADFGEYFTLLNPVEYGDLVVGGSAADGTYGVTQATDQNGGIVGVLSDTAGFVGNAKYGANGNLVTTGRDVVGFLGQIKTHVSDINGPIHIGDPITASEIAGYGQKATAAGQIIGHAMEDFDPNTGSTTTACPAGSPVGAHCGRIKVLVEISWYDPSTEMAGNLQGQSFANLNITGDLSTYHLVVTGDATFKANIIVGGHIITAGDTPEVTAVLGAGTDVNGISDATCSIVGNDTSGKLTIQTGTQNLTDGAQCSLTFTKSFDSAPHPVLTPTNKDSAGAGVYVQTTETGMVILFSHAPEASHIYTFNFVNIQ